MTRLEHPALGTLAFDEDGVAETRVKIGDADVAFGIWLAGAPETDRLQGLASLVARATELHEVNLAALRGDLARQVWDYGFDPALSDYLVCVETDLSGGITRIDMES